MQTQLLINLDWPQQQQPIIGLKVTKKEYRKREKMIERQKTEVIAAKYYNNKGGISLYNRKKRNHNNDTGNNIDKTKPKTNI